MAYVGLERSIWAEVWKAPTSGLISTAETFGFGVDIARVSSETEGMKSSLLATFAAFTLVASNAHALGGGPWDNDSTDGTQGGGLHSAVMTGPNLTGVVQLNIDPQAALDNPGIFVVFHEGNIASGEAQGIINHPERMVAGTLSGDIEETIDLSGTAFSVTRPQTGGAFIADIYQTYPTYQWEGEGQIDTVATDTVYSAFENSTSTTTETVVSNGNTTVTTGTDSVNVDGSIIAIGSTVKFTIRGIRTFAAATLGTANGGGGGGGVIVQ